MEEFNELTNSSTVSKIATGVAVSLSSLIAGAATATGFFIFGATFQIAALVCIPVMYLGYAIYTTYLNYQKESELQKDLQVEIEEISELIGENSNSKTKLTILIKTMQEKINAKNIKLHQDELYDLRDKINKLKTEIDSVFPDAKSKKDYKAFLTQVLCDIDQALLTSRPESISEDNFSTQTDEEEEAENSLLKRVIAHAKNSALAKKINEFSRFGFSFLAGALTVLGIFFSIMAPPVGAALAGVITAAVIFGVVLACIDHYAVRKQENRISKLEEKCDEFSRIEFRTQGFNNSLVHLLKLVHEREKSELILNRIKKNNLAYFNISRPVNVSPKKRSERKTKNHSYHSSSAGLIFSSSKIKKSKHHETMPTSRPTR
jgi:hypothetical protein